MNEAKGYKFSYAAGKEDLIIVRKRKVPEGVKLKINARKQYKFEDWIERNNGN
jgi:hypothetical protein